MSAKNERWDEIYNLTIRTTIYAAIYADLA